MDEKTLPVTGGCLCGAVRYQSDAPPTEVSYCHCRMCQQSSGAPYFLGGFLPVESFRFTRGQPKFFKSSDWVERGFCETCGSPLIMRDGTDTHAVYIGTFDHPEQWPPTFCHSGMESRIPWDTIHDDLPCWNTEDDPEYIKAREILEKSRK